MKVKDVGNCHEKADLGIIKAHKYKEDGINYLNTSINIDAHHTDHHGTFNTCEVKIEEIDSSEQFIDQNGVHDRKEYTVKTEIDSARQYHEAEDYFHVNIEETSHQDASDSTNTSTFETAQNDSKKCTKQKSHKCHLCDFVCQKPFHLQRHIEAVHLDLKKFKCHLCQYASNQKGHLKLHVDTIHLKIKQHKCNLCGFSASQKCNLQIHMNSMHVNLKKHLCKFCEYVAKSNAGLVRHTRSAHLSMKNVCQVCQHKCIDKKDLEKHMERMHLDCTPHKCTFCDYVAKQEHHLKMHIANMHQNRRKFAFQLCDNGKADLESAHHTDHHGTVSTCEVKFEEIDSSEQFIDQNGVHEGKESTVRTKMDSAGPYHEAEDSSYVNIEETPHQDASDFTNTSKLETAQNYSKKCKNSCSSEQKSHNCHLCDFVSNRRSHLQRHIEAVHLDLKKFKCHLCQYASNQKGNLKHHVDSVHLKIKEHKCDLCEFSASQKSTLQIHVNSMHVNLKKHLCKFCEFVAKSNAGLVRHTRSAHPSMNNVCRVCEHKCIDEKDLKKHMESMHLDFTPHKCTFCDYVAKQEHHLKMHIANMHQSRREFAFQLCDNGKADRENAQHTYHHGALSTCEVKIEEIDSSEELIDQNGVHDGKESIAGQYHEAEESFNVKIEEKPYQDANDTTNTSILETDGNVVHEGKEYTFKIEIDTDRQYHETENLFVVKIEETTHQGTNDSTNTSILETDGNVVHDKKECTVGTEIDTAMQYEAENLFNVKIEETPHQGANDTMNTSMLEADRNGVHEGIDYTFKTEIDTVRQYEAENLFNVKIEETPHQGANDTMNSSILGLDGNGVHDGKENTVETEIDNAWQYEVENLFNVKIEETPHQGANDTMNFSTLEADGNGVHEGKEYTFKTEIDTARQYEAENLFDVKNEETPHQGINDTMNSSTFQIDGNGVHDGKEYTVETEIDTTRQYEVENLCNVKIEETPHQGAKDTMNSPTLETDGNGMHDGNNYTVETEIDTVCQYHETENIFNVKIEETSCQDASNTTNTSTLETARNSSEKCTKPSSLKHKSHECHLCDFASVKRFRLQRHIEAVHLNVKKFKCHLCQYASYQKGHLKLHIDTIHLKLKQHKCQLCEFSASQNCNLQIHINSMHGNLKKHPCKICEYKANSKAGLAEHMRSDHLSIIENVCEVCEHKCIDKKDLKNHMDSIHLDWRPYRCTFCDYGSKQKHHLKKHITGVHLNMREFVCQLCGNAYNTKADLKRHVGSVHSNLKTRVMCNLSDFTMYHESSFTKHIDAVHTDKPSLDA